MMFLWDLAETTNVDQITIVDFVSANLLSAFFFFYSLANNCSISFFRYHLIPVDQVSGDTWPELKPLQDYSEQFIAFLSLVLEANVSQ